MLRASGDDDAMLGGNWTKRTVLDLGKLACATVLFTSPWIFGFAGTPAWNLWVCGYAMLTISLADLTAEADWEAETSLYLGVWLMAAPWLFGFVDDSAATLVHLVGGISVSLLSAAELYDVEHNPPWRFRPAAARRAGPVASMPEASMSQDHAPILIPDRLPPAPRSGARRLGRANPRAAGAWHTVRRRSRGRGVPQPLDVLRA
jgi:hypothetical protein